MSQNGPQLTNLRRRPNWPPVWRQLAIVLWSGFLGAVLLLLAVLMGWEALHAVAESPDFAVLGAVFVVGWLISLITCVMALSLSREPQPQIRADDEVSS